VLDVASTDASGHGQSTLTVGTRGATLEGVAGLPWQTVVVAEDGMKDLGGSVSVTENEDGDVDVVNGTGRALDDVLVWAPKKGVAYVKTLAPGGHTSIATASFLMGPHALPSHRSGGFDVHSLDTSRFASLVPETALQAWTALASAAGSEVDFFPDDEPMVFGEVHGGEPTKSDSGLSVEVDRMFLRVVGRGGTP
jgi:hypothetical protein